MLSWLIALAGVLWLANDIPPFLLARAEASLEKRLIKETVSRKLELLRKAP